MGLFGPSKKEKQQKEYEETIKRLTVALDEYYHLNLKPDERKIRGINKVSGVT
jgi:hypothetical protein